MQKHDRAASAPPQTLTCGACEYWRTRSESNRRRRICNPNSILFNFSRLRYIQFRTEAISRALQPNKINRWQSNCGTDFYPSRRPATPPAVLAGDIYQQNLSGEYPRAMPRSQASSYSLYRARASIVSRQLSTHTCQWQQAKFGQLHESQAVRNLALLSYPAISLLLGSARPRNATYFQTP